WTLLPRRMSTGSAWGAGAASGADSGADPSGAGGCAGSSAPCAKARGRTVRSSADTNSKANWRQRWGLGKLFTRAGYYGPSPRSRSEGQPGFRTGGQSGFRSGDLLGRGQLLVELALLVSDALGHGGPHLGEQVTTAPAALRPALAPKSKDSPGRGPGRDGEVYLAVEGGYLHAAAERRDVIWHPDGYP